MKKFGLMLLAGCAIFAMSAQAQETITTEPAAPEQVVPVAPEVPQQTVTTVVPVARDAITNEVVDPEPEKKEEKKSLRDEVRGKMKE